MSPDKIVHQFLTAARKEHLSCLVLYGFEIAPGKPVVRMSSNVDKGATAGILTWLHNQDAAAIEAAAIALYVYDVPPSEGHSAEDSWAELPEEIREDFRKAAMIALAAAKRHAGEKLPISEVA